MIEKIKGSKYIYEIYLIIASVFWAMAFIWMKQAMDHGMTAQQVLLVRYSVAVVLMTPFCVKELKKIRRVDLFLGMIGGLLMFASMLAQTLALGVSTPSNSAFITTLYVIMVPFVAWGVNKIRPTFKVYVCAAIALVGLYILTMTPGQAFAIDPAAALTALSAFIFALQVVFITYAGQRMGVKLLTYLPLIFITIFTFITCAFTGGLVINSPDIVAAVGNVALAAMFATILAGMCQVLGQRRVDPSRAAIIMSTEAVFTCAISVIMGLDILSWNLIVGGLIITAAIVVSELNS